MNGPIDSAEGLTGGEAARRLAAQGANVLPETPGRGWRHIVLATVREPMFLLVTAAAALYLLLGDVGEGLFLVLMVMVMVGMTLYQEGRTEHALQALRDLSTPTATVYRDGLRRRVPAAELVPGDLIELSEGVRVPADALVLSQDGLMADESMLTGESLPVAKVHNSPTAPAPGALLPNRVYAGTLIVQGNGMARVERTGAHSELGAIGASLDKLVRPPSPLQREVRKLAGWLAVLAAIVSIALVVLLASRGMSWIDAVLAGLALSMSMLPEEFPVILTVFPALGAWRLARVQVLTRRLSAIEILGATTVLCVDKTGTLTENRMRLQLLWRHGQPEPAAARGELSASSCEVLMCALLASRPRSADPLETALWDAAQQCEALAGGFSPAWEALREYPLTPTRPMLARAWSQAGETAIALKGAPEAVLPLCTLSDSARAAALREAAALATDGLRVLAVARAGVAAGPLPDDPTSCRYELAGLVALADPLRADIPQAVADCVDAGIRVLMITGDHPDTARAIARQAGLPGNGAITGADLAALPPAALIDRLRAVTVCARIVPQQKLAIVQALQQGGEVVAMTGDGVNDAPALRAANVGVAMGLRGTDVAREAAELTLLDDRFASLVAAIAGGRRIFDNMRRSMTYVAVIHVPIAGLALLPPLLGWPVLFYPAHIVFLQLMIDPACALAFENQAGEPDLMRRPPRRADEPLFGPGHLVRALLQGAWTLAWLAPTYGLALHQLPENQARAVTFAALVMCNLALLAVNLRTAPARPGCAGRNPVFWYISGTALVLLGSSLFVPGLASLFRFGAPAMHALLGAMVLASCVGWSIGLVHRRDGRTARQLARSLIDT